LIYFNYTLMTHNIDARGHIARNFFDFFSGQK